MNPESVVDRLDILCGNAADHGARRYVLCNDCSGSYDRAVADSNTRQNGHVRTDPDMIADLHRLGDAVLREQTETAEEFRTLSNKATPMHSKYIQPVENGAPEADAILEMLEVRLITVKKITE